MAYTNIDDPSAYFQTALHSSANSATITNDGNSNLKPDFIWSKARGAAYNHGLYDSTRGVTKFLSSNTTSAETTASSGYDLTSFNTDGFSTGNNQYNTICGGTTYVAWQWKANGGTTSSNTTGSINATVQANTTAGFSIITWSGTGSVGTIGHGLGQAPTVLIVKNRTTSVDWAVYHKDMTDAGYTLALNNSDGQIDSGTNRWNHTAPTSSVFSVGAGQQTNQSSNNMICYAFAEKKGFSKFGQYAGSGGTNGTIVYTGFKPAFVLFKNSSNSGENWIVYDHKRDTYNEAFRELFPNDSSAEYTATAFDIDILSNGFKQRGANTGSNGLNRKYIYMAFAENPFVTSTGVPACAR